MSATRPARLTAFYAWAIVGSPATLALLLHTHDLRVGPAFILGLPVAMTGIASRVAGLSARHMIFGSIASLAAIGIVVLVSALLFLTSGNVN